MNKWLNYDLHMHSFYSFPIDGNRVQEMSAEDYVKTLVGKDIDVFSITDHNVFNSGYYLEILSVIADQKIRVIFGAELDVYVDNNDSKFHMGIYFQPKAENAKVIEQALIDLYGGNQKPDLFQILNKFNSLNLKFIIIPEYDKSRGLTKISETLAKNDMMDSFRRYEMKRIFNAYDRGIHFEQSEVLEWAKAFYYRTKEFSDYCDNLSGDDEKLFKNTLKMYIQGKIDSSKASSDVKKFGDLIFEYSLEFAYFHFSDWHNSSPYTHTIKNMVFGDDDYPFESLEIAVCDPYSRIRVLNNGEQIISDVNSLREISFLMNGHKVIIPLTEGLNSIIGKRASGKSLLISVLMQLKNSNDLDVSRYSSFDIDINSIKATKSNGTIVSVGQLSSVTYLKQADIKKLYDKPTSAESVLADKFPKLPEIKIDDLDYIIGHIDKIKPFDFNYKEFNTYCLQKENSKVFSYQKIPNINKAQFNTRLNDLIAGYNGFHEILKDIGFGLGHLSNLRKSLIETTNIYKTIISKYDELINKINTLISEYVKDASDNESVSSQIKKNYADSMSIIKNNLDNLLLYKQIEQKINSIENISAGSDERIVIDDFLFLTKYSCSGKEIKERINQAIESVLKPKVAFSRISKNLKEYMNGGVIYSKDNQTFSNGLNKEFKSTSFETNNLLFRIKNHDLYDDKKGINDLITSGCLIDISNSSPGDKAAAYLEILMSSFDSILVLDQPEDDIDNHYISNVLVPLIRKKKRTKQLIFVTHNPSVAVYADSFNYIFANNNGNNITYDIRTIEKPDDKEIILSILDGGRKSFYNRNMKYGDITGDFRDED